MQPGKDRCHVAYVLAEFPSLSETFILREILALLELEIDVRIFALRRPRETVVHDRARDLLGRTVYRPSRPARLRYVLPTNGRRVRALAGMLRAARRSPGRLATAAANFPTAVAFARAACEAGVTHVHAHFAALTSDVGAAMATMLGAGFSMSVHAGDLYTAHPSVLARRAAPARFVTACTRHGADTFRLLCPDQAHKLVLVSHGVFPERFEPRTSAEPLIVAIGRLEQKKGFGYLVAACHLLKERGLEFRCTIVGTGSQAGSLRRSARSAGLDNHVVFTGALNEDQVRDLFQRAAMVVAPCVVTASGDRDGIPNVLLEALAMKVPVVVCPVGGISELVRDGQEGLVVPTGDAEALAAGIGDLLENRDRARAMGERGRLRVLERHDARRNIGELARLLQGGSIRQEGSGT